MYHMTIHQRHHNVVLYTFNFYNAVCQLHLNRKGDKKETSVALGYIQRVFPHHSSLYNLALLQLSTCSRRLVVYLRYPLALGFWSCSETKKQKNEQTKKLHFPQFKYA